MGDDAELWIESGGDLTTLIPDYYWDDEYDDYNDSSKRKKNTMVFIDAESVSADHCSGIMGQWPILMYGEPAHNKIDNKIVKDIRRVPGRRSGSHQQSSDGSADAKQKGKSAYEL